jgi:hypothetical protein
MRKFDYSLDYKNLDLRKNPELYRVGRGEQGVLTVEPYRTEIVGHWKFRTPEIARESSAKIYEMFLEYKQQKDFVGMVNRRPDGENRAAFEGESGSR